MATQAGISFSKFLVLVGAGLTGSVLVKNGRFSDILSEIQSMMSRLDDGRESLNGDSDLAAQVRRLAQELRQISTSRPIIVASGNSGQSGNLASFVMPAAMVGALGYGYMWWKGLSFSDLMYVTKRNMKNVVASMTKQMDHVSAALAATKRHLTQRIQNIDEKMDEQKELSRLINDEVIEVHGNITQMGFDIDAIQAMICGLEEKIGSLDSKQDFAIRNLFYLVKFVGGDKDGSMEKFIQNSSAKASKMLPAPVYSEKHSLKGLQYIADTIQSGVMGRANANAASHNEINDLAIQTPPRGATIEQKSLIDGASLSRTIST